MKFFRALILNAAMLLVSLCGVSPTLAQTVPSVEAMQVGKELASVMSESAIADLTTNLTAQIWPQLEKALREQNARIDAATTVALRQEFERVLVEQTMQLMNEAPAIYARYFTAQEMRDIIAFYRTRTGAKALKVLPQATADMTAIMFPRMQNLQEKINLAFLNVLHKRGFYAQ